MTKKKKTDIIIEQDDNTKINEWLQRNEVSVIPQNQGSEMVVKSFFGRRRKKQAKTEDRSRIPTL